MVKKMTRGLCVCLCALLWAGCLPAAGRVKAEPQSVQAAEQEKPQAAQSDYTAYLEAHGGEKPSDAQPITLRPSVTETVEGRAAARLNEGAAALTLTFSVPEAGWYRPTVSYCPLSEGASTELITQWTLDGVVPFSEAAAVQLSRVFVNGESRRDGSGNDLRPEQLAAADWWESPLWDDSGYHAEPFALYLEKGAHTLSVAVTQGELALESVTLAPKETLPSYREVAAAYEEKGYAPSGQTVEYEAEQAGRKSGAALYPDTDRASAATSPADPSYTRLNVISSSEPGDWLEWTVSVPADGLYQIGMRVMQDGNRGMVSTRRLYVDGKVPFSEAEYVEFPYAVGWYNYVLGGDTPWQFYLTAGEHTLRLEVTTGRFAAALRTLQDIVEELNQLCRRITMVTGLSPDVYRDYNFSAELPDLHERLLAVRDRLSAELSRLSAEMDTSGSSLSTVEDLLRQVELFLKNERRIAADLNNFRTNISTLGTQILEMTGQKLTMDTLVLFSSKQTMRPAKAGFFAQLSYDFSALIGSFLIDYNAVGGDAEKDGGHVTVWASTGRDQANILRRLIDDFTSESGIGVHLSLVGDSATLLQATLAHKGPDIALFVEKTLPVNLAARGALEDLSAYDGYEQITSRFYPSAMVPYTFDGGVWALPCSQGFNVMFIRTDIFAELNLSIPQTWDELTKAQTVIQRENMEVGVGQNGTYSLFETLILQNGGQFYTDDLSAVAFDTPEVLDAFRRWTGFYSEYDAAVSYDAFSYFRSGVMPLLIADYTLYNQLAVAAPEIRGLWTIAQIPGTKREDGTLDRSESATGTAAILMKSTEDKRSAFAFLDWWTTEAVQTRYSLDLEAVMGPAARYNSAVSAAVGALSWSREEYQAIRTQWESVWDIPSIPSSYYVSRNLNNAFRSVVFKTGNQWQIIEHYAAAINKEIARKNRELGIAREGASA